jgi:hypothetical protein
MRYQGLHVAGNQIRNRTFGEVASAVQHQVRASSHTRLECNRVGDRSCNEGNYVLHVCSVFLTSATGTSFLGNYQITQLNNVWYNYNTVVVISS